MEPEYYRGKVDSNDQNYINRNDIRVQSLLNRLTAKSNSKLRIVKPDPSKDAPINDPKEKSIQALNTNKPINPRLAYESTEIVFTEGLLNTLGAKIRNAIGRQKTPELYSPNQDKLAEPLSGEEQSKRDVELAQKLYGYKPTGTEHLKAEPTTTGKCEVGMHWNNIKNSCEKLSTVLGGMVMGANVLSKTANEFGHEKPEHHDRASWFHQKAAEHLRMDGFNDDAEHHQSQADLHQNLAQKHGYAPVKPSPMPIRKVQENNNTTANVKVPVANNKVLVKSF